MTNIIAFALQYKWKRREKKQTKRKINEMSLQWTWSLFDSVRPSKNAKCKEGRLNATFFFRLFLLSIFYMATCRAYYSHINVLEAQESADSAKEIDYSFVSFFLYSWLLSMSRTFQSQIALNNNTKNGMCSTKICLVTIFIQFKNYDFLCVLHMRAKHDETININVIRWWWPWHAHFKSQIINRNFRWKSN